MTEGEFPTTLVVGTVPSATLASADRRTLMTDSLPTASAATPEPRFTPLRGIHESLGATFTDFGGWQMPVRYASDLAEHRAVREAAGIFDISHMAEFLVTGTGAGQLLDYALGGKLSTLAVGRAKYSLLLADDGGIIDDVIVYCLGPEWYLVIANAGNREAVAAAFAERVSRAPIAAAFSTAPIEGVHTFGGVVGGDLARVEDVSDSFSLIAVQGPRAGEIVAGAAGVDAGALTDLGYYAAAQTTFDDSPMLLARTGYTGEDGYELLVPNARAVELWAALTEAGAAFGLVPAGLAARDTLRLEAGMPLYGHELSRGVLPAQAGLGRTVSFDKPDFVGRQALEAAAVGGSAGAAGSTPETAARPVLVGLVAEGRRAGRAGYAVFDGETPVGEVTSGALSPTLGHPIAMAFVPPSLAGEGTVLSIDVRGTKVPATVTALPFYRRKK
jgi:aminomethyltransferase